ncbi:MAG: hypothetical protein DDT23_00330 [candidate division WS2 bacterium]|nr:hypothetical protein [Candidatus Lithacetigena glycinireducens]
MGIKVRGFRNGVGPTITNNQKGDDIWRSTNNGVYDVDFADTGGGNLSHFQTKVCTAVAQGGTVLQDWTTVVSNISVPSYTTDWSLPTSTWEALQQGTNYVSVRVYDNVGNFSVLIDAFYVKKDTTRPVVNVEPDVWTHEEVEREGQIVALSGIEKVEWSVVKSPSTSTVIFSEKNQLKTRILPDKEGQYTIRLTAWNKAGSIGRSSFKLNWFLPVNIDKITIEKPLKPAEPIRKIDKVTLVKIKDELVRDDEITTGEEDLLETIDEILKIIEEGELYLEDYLKDTYIDLNDLDDDDDVEFLREALRDIGEPRIQQLNIPTPEIERITFPAYSAAKGDQVKRKSSKARCRGDINLLEMNVISPSQEELKKNPDAKSQFNISLRYDANIDVIVDIYEKMAEDSLIRSSATKRFFKELEIDIKDSLNTEYYSLLREMRTELEAIRDFVKEEANNPDNLLGLPAIYTGVPPVSQLPIDLPTEIPDQLNQLLGRRYLDPILKKRREAISKLISEKEVEIDGVTVKHDVLRGRINSEKDKLDTLTNEYNGIIGRYNYLSNAQSKRKLTPQEEEEFGKLKERRLAVNNEMGVTRNNLERDTRAYRKMKTTVGSITASLMDRAFLEKDLAQKLIWDIKATIMDSLHNSICCLIKTYILKDIKDWFVRGKTFEEFHKFLDENIRFIDDNTRVLKQVLVLLQFLYREQTLDIKKSLDALKKILDPIAEGIMCSLLMTYRSVSKRVIDGIVTPIRRIAKKNEKCFPSHKIVELIMDALNKLDQKVVDNFLLWFKTQQVKFKVREKKSHRFWKRRLCADMIHAIRLILAYSDYFKKVMEDAKKIDYNEFAEYINKSITNLLLQSVLLSTTYNKNTRMVEPIVDILRYCEGTLPSYTPEKITTKLERPAEAGKVFIYVVSSFGFTGGQKIEITDCTIVEHCIVDKIRVEIDKNDIVPRSLNKIYLRGDFEGWVLKNSFPAGSVVSIVGS